MNEGIIALRRKETTDGKEKEATTDNRRRNKSREREHNKKGYQNKIKIIEMETDGHQHEQHDPSLLASLEKSPMMHHPQHIKKKKSKRSDDDWMALQETTERGVERTSSTHLGR
jgi:hypothetical protein